MARYPSMQISESLMELFIFISVMTIAVGFNIFSPSLSSSIFGNKLFILKFIKCNPLFSSSLLDGRFELAVGLNLYPLKVEILISDRESDFLWHFLWLRQLSCKHRYWFSLLKSLRILIDSIKKNYFLVYNFILQCWLNLFLDQHNVKSDKKSINTMWIKTLKLIKLLL